MRRPLVRNLDDIVGWTFVGTIVVLVALSVAWRTILLILAILAALWMWRHW
jgi:hypothetical protein